MGRRFSGLVLDWAGVLTTNMVEVIESFEAREGLSRGLFLSRWADSRGRDLYRRLELGEIAQSEWNEGFGALLGIMPANLMERLLQDMFPAYEVMRVVREARAAGVRVAVLSNSLGREPFDPYAPYHLRGNFDVAVLSAEHGIRKPDPAIFKLPWTSWACCLSSACSPTTPRRTCSRPTRWAWPCSMPLTSR
jgi:putative hydrolase of the HAD superfamily